MNKNSTKTWMRVRAVRWTTEASEGLATPRARIGAYAGSAPVSTYGGM